MMQMANSRVHNSTTAHVAISAPKRRGRSDKTKQLDARIVRIVKRWQGSSPPRVTDVWSKLPEPRPAKPKITIRLRDLIDLGLLDPSLVRRNHSRKAHQDLALREGVKRIAEQYERSTVRQIFYRCVSQQLCPKDEAAYASLGRLIKAMRERGELDWDLIIDETRVIRTGGDGPEHIPQVDPIADANYQINELGCPHIHISRADRMTSRQGLFVEKNSLMQVIQPAANTYLDQYCGRGFSSVTYLRDVARRIVKLGKPYTLHMVSDWDPSGLHLCRAVERKISAYASEIADSEGLLCPQIAVERIAITEEQIRTFNLTQMCFLTKSTPHSESWEQQGLGDSCQVEALAPTDLVKIIRDALRPGYERERKTIFEVDKEEEQFSAAVQAQYGDVTDHLLQALKEFEAMQ